MPVYACESQPTIREANARDIRSFAHSKGMKILTFVGYSGAGYEDSSALLEHAGQALDSYDPTKTIVNTGATADGIGAVYELAKQKGFLTIGIVSSLAREEKAKLSPCVDFVFYIPDSTWGGLLPDSKKLSPTSAAIVSNSSAVVGIGGGEIAKDELLGATRSGKTVKFFPADMNHQAAIEKAQKKGLAIPTDFRGEAHSVFAKE